jgi:hypothetical protein
VCTNNTLRIIVEHISTFISAVQKAGVAKSGSAAAFAIAGFINEAMP